jgi:hypothetical protein
MVYEILSNFLINIRNLVLNGVFKTKRDDVKSNIK